MMNLIQCYSKAKMATVRIKNTKTDVILEIIFSPSPFSYGLRFPDIFIWNVIPFLRLTKL